MTRWPDFFIAGAPKAATSSLQAYLSDHPDVYMAPGEPGYFLRDFSPPPPGYLQKEEAYLSIFEEAGAAHRVGEKSVWYLVSENAAAAIHRRCPAADIIIILRDPVEMAQSLHGEMVKAGNENLLDFSEAVQAADARKDGHQLPSDAHTVPGLIYTEVARYPDQVERFLDTFGEESVHIALFEDLIHSPEGTYEQILQFLNLRLDHSPTYGVENPHQKIRLYPIYRSLVRPPQAMKDLVFALLPEDRARSLARSVRGLFRQTAPRPPMDADTRETLAEAYKPSVRRLEHLIGRDLSHWSSIEAPRTRGGGSRPRSLEGGC